MRADDYVTWGRRYKARSCLEVGGVSLHDDPGCCNILPQLRGRIDEVHHLPLLDLSPSQHMLKIFYDSRHFQVVDMARHLVTKRRGLLAAQFPHGLVQTTTLYFVLGGSLVE